MGAGSTRASRKDGGRGDGVTATKVPWGKVAGIEAGQEKR
jgi:hypothetical protein